MVRFPFFLVSLYAEEALWSGVVIARRGPRLSRFSLWPTRNSYQRTTIQLYTYTILLSILKIWLTLRLVSREHLVAIVPPVRVLDRVRIDVPAVVVPVHVDRAKHTSVIVYKIIYITASQTMTGWILSGTSKSTNLIYQFLLFFWRYLPHSHTRHTQCDSREKNPKTMTWKP